MLKFKPHWDHCESPACGVTQRGLEHQGLVTSPVGWNVSLKHVLQDQIPRNPLLICWGAKEGMSPRPGARGIWQHRVSPQRQPTLLLQSGSASQEQKFPVNLFTEKKCRATVSVWFECMNSFCQKVKSEKKLRVTVSIDVLQPEKQRGTGWLVRGRGPAAAFAMGLFRRCHLR